MEHWLGKGQCSRAKSRIASLSKWQHGTLFHGQLEIPQWSVHPWSVLKKITENTNESVPSVSRFQEPSFSPVYSSLTSTTSHHRTLLTVLNRSMGDAQPSSSALPSLRKRPRSCYKNYQSLSVRTRFPSGSPSLSSMSSTVY